MNLEVNSISEALRLIRFYAQWSREEWNMYFRERQIRVFRSVLREKVGRDDSGSRLGRHFRGNGGDLSRPSMSKLETGIQKLTLWSRYFST